MCIVLQTSDLNPPGTPAFPRFGRYSKGWVGRGRENSIRSHRNPGPRNHMAIWRTDKIQKAGKKEEQNWTTPLSEFQNSFPELWNRQRGAGPPVAQKEPTWGARTLASRGTKTI